MWRGGNGGALKLLPGAVISWRMSWSPHDYKYRTPIYLLGHPSPPEHALLVLEACVTYMKDQPPKLRCEASCLGLHGTEEAIGQCRKRSPRGTRQQPVVFMLSTPMGLCGWWPLKSPILVGPKWKKDTKTKTGRKDLKLKRDPPPRGSLWEMLRQGAGSYGEPLRGPVASSCWIFSQR
jgi:hypothetical protein